MNLGSAALRRLRKQCCAWLAPTSRRRQSRTPPRHETVRLRCPATAGHGLWRSDAEQWERRFAEHCRPINLLVEELIAEKGGRWMPFVAPYHGGAHAEVLLLFQDPGRMTNQANGGSGFIGCENDDPSAETLALCLDQAGVEQRQVMPWNAYPWYLPEQAGVSAAQRVEGLDALLSRPAVAAGCSHRSNRRRSSP